MSKKYIPKYLYCKKCFLRGRQVYQSSMARVNIVFAHEQQREGGQGQGQPKAAGVSGGCGVAPVFRPAGAVLHVDVIGARPVDAISLVPTDPGFPQPGATTDVPPLPVDLLPDLAAHGRLQSRQVLLFFLLSGREKQFQ